MLVFALTQMRSFVIKRIVPVAAGKKMSFGGDWLVLIEIPAGVQQAVLSLHSGACWAYALYALAVKCTNTICSAAD